MHKNNRVVTNPKRVASEEIYRAVHDFMQARLDGNHTVKSALADTIADAAVNNPQWLVPQGTHMSPYNALKELEVAEDRGLPYRGHVARVADPTSAIKAAESVRAFVAEVARHDSVGEHTNGPGADVLKQVLHTYDAKLATIIHNAKQDRAGDSVKRDPDYYALC